MTTMMNDERRHRVTLRLRWIAWFLFTIVWTFLLVAKIPENVQFSDDPELSYRIRIVIAKTVHALCYAGWTILTGSLFTKFGLRLALLFLLMNHAVATEYVQLVYSNRDGCLRDSLIDHAGIFVGLVLSWSWWTRPNT
jgi:VanZ family protein